MKVFAIAGPVLNHPRLAINGFPAVVTAQAQCVAMTGHHAVGIAKPAHGIAIAIDHFDELAVVVVAVVLDEGFHRQVVDDAFDVGQAAKLRAIYFERLTGSGFIAFPRVLYNSARRLSVRHYTGIVYRYGKASPPLQAQPRH